MNGKLEHVAIPAVENHTVSQQSAPLYDYRRSLVIYAVVIGFLFLVNALTDHSYWWVVWPALGWGLAIVLKILKARFPK